MWRVILLVFCYHVVSQAEDKTTRHTRELIECCPCPGSTLPPDLVRSRTPDDCPCQRSADSEGASSMLFPSRTSPKNSIPFMRSNDPNDMKNLLEPEVGLAKSMLQTLREATEEEYRDALARDAARSSDAVPEESARNVVIIVKPRTSDDDDLIVPEASNVKETRCVNPLASLGQMRSAKPQKTMQDLFRIPKPKPNFMHRNVWNMDSNVGASNVQPSVVDVGGSDPKRLPLFKFRTPLKEISLRNLNTNGKNNPSVFENLEETLRRKPNLFPRLNLPHIPNMKVDSDQGDDSNENTDLTSASSNKQDLASNKNINEIFRMNNRPPLLKNLFKLKDVELIPKTIPKLHIFKPKLDSNNELTQPKALHRDVDDKCDSDNSKDVASKEVSSEDNSEGLNGSYKASSLQKAAKTFIEPIKDQSDTITSPSEPVPGVIAKNIKESDETDCSDSTSEERGTTTEGISEVLENDKSNEVDHVAEPQTDETINDINNLSPNAEVIDVENGALDSNTDCSNNIVNKLRPENTGEPILPPQLEKDVREDLTEEDINDFSSSRSSEEETESVNEPHTDMINNKIALNIKPISPLSKTLTTIKENVKNGLESLKRKNVIPPLPLANDKISTLINTDEDSQSDALINETKTDSKEIENEDHVTFSDLQKLSDDLLVSSSNNKQVFNPNEAETKDDLDKPDLKSNQESNQFVKNEPEYLELKTSTDVSDKASIPDTKPPSSKGKACAAGFNEQEIKREPVLRKTETDDNNKDMTVEASAPRALTALPALLDPLNLNEQLESSLLQSTDPFDPLNLKMKLGSPLLPNLDPFNLNEKLKSPVFPDPINLNLDPLNLRSSLQDIVVQPIIPDDPLNILNKPIADELKLPTFEDLRQQLSNAFDTNERSVEDSFSDEDRDCSNNIPVEMAQAASTNNLRKAPSVRPLENMNVDIFQFNPLSNSDLLSNTPRLNLNNFKTKLPIPNNLDLKPVKLESRVANKKGNVLGASLSFGDDKKTRKAKPKSNTLSGNSLGGLPSLDELRNTLQSNTQNLLGNPLHSDFDLFKDSLRASAFPDIDELRRNTEKTLKGLHQRMKSTFKGGKISNPLTEKFARPQDILEDMNDKLKAIHYDLNDRLSSIHEDILDQTRIKPLAIPHLPSLSTNRNNNIWKPKAKPSRLQSSASTISSMKMDPLENSKDRSLLRTSAKNSPKINTSNVPRTLLGAESSPMPSRVEFPKYKTSDTRKSTLPSLLRIPSSRQGSENTSPLKKPFVPPRQTIVKDLKKPVLQKPNPFKDKLGKVTITFATTTASPMTSPTGSVTPSLNQKKPDTMKNSRESVRDRLGLPRTNPSDGIQSASNIKPNVLSSAKSKNNFKTAIADKDLPQTQNVEPVGRTNTKTPSFRETKDKFRLNESTLKKLSLPWPDKNTEGKNEVLTESKKAASKALVWPKTGEDSFLAKVREAMQTRLKNFNPVKTVEREEVPLVKSNSDMLKSASENRDIVLTDDTLKENVSYKCRMMCTKE